MLCIVCEITSKYTTVIQGKIIGTSIHLDYSLFHFKSKDVSALKLPISKFIFLDAKAEVTEVIEAAQLATRGVNYKTAKRDDAELTEDEQAEVDAAFTLATNHVVRALLLPHEDLKAEPPAADQPKIELTPEIVGIGLKLAELDRQEEALLSQVLAAVEEDPTAVEFDADKAITADELITAVDKLAETPDDEAEGDPEDPLSTVKPSRKKRRR